MVTPSLADPDTAPTVAEEIRPRRPARKRIEQGQIVGTRFVALEEIGEGGMGTVLRAYDPTLCRELALKQMRPGALDDRAAERALREAQSMARLSHPNVVAVYDAFVDQGQVTIAMEFVPGETLRRWAKQERPWQEVVAMFRQAGEGLAAAHRAGLVHRDFKPSNVLVTPRGEVKVGDFGLAKGLWESTSSSGLGAGGDGRESAEDLASPLTDAKTVMGTPRYMAPEQRRGGEVGPAADQFAFCVALWEALVGKPPFATIDERRELPPEWPRSSPVPRPVVAAIHRGLAKEPGERWPSMEALLVELDVEPGRRRTRAFIVGAAGIGVAGAVAFATRAVAPPPACTGSAAQLEDVWGERPRRVVREALLRAKPTMEVEPVVSGLDDYATAWIAGHREACEATMVRGEQSPRMMDLRMYCLAGAKRDLVATIDVLRVADATTADKAKSLVRALPKLERCGDLEALEADVPPPSDPEVAAEVERLEAPLARARTLNVAGHYPEARAAIEPVHEAAAKLGWGPLWARAAETHGDIVESTGDYAGSVALHQEAVRLALQHDVSKTAIAAASNLAYLLAYQLDRPDEADAWVTVAEGLVAGYEPGGRLEADVAQTRAAIAHTRGDYSTAARELRRALTMIPQSSGEAGSLRHNLAATLYAQGEYAAAAVEFREVVNHFEGLYGGEHPAVADALDALGTCLGELGQLQEAETVLRRALAIRERTLGTLHDDTANNLHNLANIISDRGKLEESLRLYAQAVEIWQEVEGPEHPDVATGLGAMATVRAKLGETDEAEALQRRALSIIEHAKGLDDPDVAYPLTNLGDLLRRRGELDEAQLLLERALKVREEKLGPEHPTLAPTLDHLGRVHADAGRIDEARAALIRAREIQRKAGVGQETQAETQARLDAL